MKAGMNASKRKSTVKGKIILTILLGGIAVLGSYWLYQHTFGEMSTAIEQLQEPNRKLQAVNDLLIEVAQSGDAFKNTIVSKSSSSFEAFLEQNQRMHEALDSLKWHCRQDENQTAALDSIGLLLDQRIVLFRNYVAFRWEQQRDNPLKNQIAVLDSIINEQQKEWDEKSEVTKTVMQTTTVIEKTAKKESENEGFFKRLFSKKKPETPEEKESTTIYETPVEVSLEIEKNDSLFTQAEIILKNIERIQKSRSAQFNQKEAELAAFESTFSQSILQLLKSVEQELILQTDETYQHTNQVINANLQWYIFIIIIFLAATATLTWVILSDITKTNQYKLELEAANIQVREYSQSKERFLSNMSHEIRTPLQSIIGFSEQLSQQAQPEKESLLIMQQSAEHLLQIVNEILDYSQLTSGKFQIHHYPFQPYKMVNDCYSMLQRQAQVKDLNFVLDNRLPEDKYVKSDAFRLRQILLNLLGNAFKFTRKGEVILRAFQIDDGRYVFMVEDTGIGIPEEKKEAIFQAFEQAAIPTSEPYPGTGLGLSIVKSLTDQMNGTVTLTSEPDKGTSFMLVFPFESSEKPLIKENELDVAFSTEGQVWIVDDDPWIIKLCEIIFQKHNIQYKTFSSPLDVLNTETPEDLHTVFVDIRMPEMNGKQLCQALKNRLTNEVRIIAFTAQALPHEQEDIKAAGFDDILLKPFHETELLQCLPHATPEPINQKISEEYFEPLKTMIGDDETFQAIVKQMIAETREDYERVKSRWPEMSDEAALELHKMASRVLQMGQHPLGHTLRELEWRVRAQQLINREEWTELENKLEEFLTEAQSKLQNE